MADKILRPIVDVEIVEQMTENDTVLIEHGGEIKRAKGVAGGSGGGSAGGKAYLIVTTMDMTTNEWTVSTDLTYAKVQEMWNKGIIENIQMVDNNNETSEFQSLNTVTRIEKMYDFREGGTNEFDAFCLMSGANNVIIYRDNEARVDG